MQKEDVSCLKISGSVLLEAEEAHVQHGVGKLVVLSLNSPTLLQQWVWSGHHLLLVWVVPEVDLSLPDHGYLPDHTPQQERLCLQTP